jgi:phage gpG-like protein
VIRISMSGVGDVQAELDAMADRLRDLRPVMQIAAQDTVTLTDQSFEDQTSPSGDGWAEHSPTTVALRMKRRNQTGPRKRRPRGQRAQEQRLPDVRKLLDTGRLRQSMTGTAGRTGFSFGSNVIYAGAQQFGNPENRLFGKKRAPIPARPFMPIVAEGSRFALMTTGSAGQHWSRVRALVSHYIRTGELTG